MKQIIYSVSQSCIIQRMSLPQLPRTRSIIKIPWALLGFEATASRKKFTLLTSLIVLSDTNVEA